DGKWIYFESDRSGDGQVWKMPAGGGEAIRVTTNGGFTPFESPDGQWVYYNTKHGGLCKLPQDGGEEIQVLESATEHAYAVVNERISHIPRLDATVNYSIQFTDFPTQKIRTITTIDRQALCMGLSVSLDRRWILWSQWDQSGSDLMLVENFR